MCGGSVIGGGWYGCILFVVRKKCVVGWFGYVFFCFVFVWGDRLEGDMCGICEDKEGEFLFGVGIGEVGVVGNRYFLCWVWFFVYGEKV